MLEIYEIKIYLNGKNKINVPITYILPSSKL